MTRMGRKPKGVEHLNGLDGSQLAHARMRLFLSTLMGQTSVPEACGELKVCEARFHAHRHKWLQEALKLLEPRRAGRPRSKLSAEEIAQRLREVEAENQQLREQLQVAQVREQLAGILPPTAVQDPPPIKKNVGGRAEPLRRPR